MAKTTLFDRMKRNPRGDWTINDVATICRDYGLSCEPPRGGGSHYKISDPQGKVTEILTIPARRPVLPVYIRAWACFEMASTMSPISAYRVVVQPLLEADGGGYIAWVPALPGCMSHGSTAAEARDNAAQAINEWIDEAIRQGREVPLPHENAVSA